MLISRLNCILFIILVAVLSSCSRPPQLVGIDNVETPVRQQQKAELRKVFITTTREATSAKGVFYSSDRSEEVGLASVVVSIPPNHAQGQIERPKRLPPDPSTEFAIIEPTVYQNGDSFVATINNELKKLPPADRNILLFVHGYNNTTSDSILRVAQFVEDTDFHGIPILFAWASAAKTSQYIYDLNSALIARPKLLQVTGYLGQTIASGFDIFAHSMGSLLLMEAIVQDELAGTFNNSGRLENIMLAAPDIDLDLFKSQLGRLSKNNRNITVFVSQDDRALNFSSRLAGGIKKVGAADSADLQELGVSVIDLSAVDDSTSGSHSKFAGSPEIVQLIGKGMKDDNYKQPPNQPTLVEILNGVPVISIVVD